MRAFMKLASAETIAPQTGAKATALRTASVAEPPPGTVDPNAAPDFLEFPQPLHVNRMVSNRGKPAAENSQPDPPKPNAGMPKVSTDFCEDLRSVGPAVRVPSYLREISARIRSGAEGLAPGSVAAGTKATSARTMDPALWRIVQAWPRLSTKVRKMIIGLIESTERGRPARPTPSQKLPEPSAPQAVASNRCKSASVRPKRSSRGRRSEVE